MDLNQDKLEKACKEVGLDVKRGLRFFDKEALKADKFFAEEGIDNIAQYKIKSRETIEKQIKENKELKKENEQIKITTEYNKGELEKILIFKEIHEDETEKVKDELKQYKDELKIVSDEFNQFFEKSKDELVKEEFKKYFRKKYIEENSNYYNDKFYEDFRDNVARSAGIRKMVGIEENKNMEAINRLQKVTDEITKQAQTADIFLKSLAYIETKLKKKQMTQEQAAKFAREQGLDELIKGFSGDMRSEVKEIAHLGLKMRNNPRFGEDILK